MAISRHSRPSPFIPFGTNRSSRPKNISARFLVHVHKVDLPLRKFSFFEHFSNLLQNIRLGCAKQYHHDAEPDFAPPSLGQTILSKIITTLYAASPLLNDSTLNRTKPKRCFTTHHPYLTARRVTLPTPRLATPSPYHA